MYGELTSEQIEALLHQQVVGRIGCYADGLVYVVPISYAYDGEFVYGHTIEGMKVHMMRKNPKVCFEVDSLVDMANWKSVIAWAEFEELNDVGVRKDALRKLHERMIPEVSTATSKLSPEWPFVPTDVNAIKGVVFRFRITHKSGKFENNSVPSFLSFG